MFAGLGDQIIKKFSSNKLSAPWFFYIHLFDLHTPVVVPNVFTDKKFANKVKLSQQEWQFLIDQSLNEMYASGVGGISGGFVDISLEEYGENPDTDEIDKNLIAGHMKVGVQSDCENNVSTCRIIFHRHEREIEFD